MTHHFAMTSSLLIKILKIDKFGVFLSDIDFKTKMDIFRDDISRLINQCHPQATEGSLRRTLCVRQPRSASKRSALVSMNSPGTIFGKKILKVVSKGTSQLLSNTKMKSTISIAFWMRYR